MLDGCVQVLQPGSRCVLGHLAGGGFGIWLVAGGPPIARYSNDGRGWFEACTMFQSWEQPQQPARANHAMAIGWAVAIALVVIVYVAFHAYKYHQCTFTPGLFAWPSGCF